MAKRAPNDFPKDVEMCFEDLGNGPYLCAVTDRAEAVGEDGTAWIGVYRLERVLKVQRRIDVVEKKELVRRTR